jgi:hypothetical protein
MSPCLMAPAAAPTGAAASPDRLCRRIHILSGDGCDAEEKREPHNRADAMNRSLANTSGMVLASP